MCICQRIEEGEQYNQCRQSGDGGRIDTGKLTDEKFCRRFALGGILHQFQYTGKSTFLEGFGDLDAYDFVGRNHSGKHFPALADVAGNTFSRQCGGVEGGNFVQHRSVQGDALSGFYFDGFAYLHTLGSFDKCTAVSDDRCRFGTYVEQGADVTLGFVYGFVLKELSQGVEEHDGNAFGIFAYIEGAEGGDGHKGEFAEHVLLQDAFPGFPHHREAYGEIGKQVPYKRYILSLEEGGVSSIQDEPSEEQ